MNGGRPYRPWGMDEPRKAERPLTPADLARIRNQRATAERSEQRRLVQELIKEANAAMRAATDWHEDMSQAKCFVLTGMAGLSEVGRQLLIEAFEPDWQASVENSYEEGLKLTLKQSSAQANKPRNWGMPESKGNGSPMVDWP